MAKIKGFSDKYMLRLFRKACLVKHGGKCILCPNTNVNELEIHHLIKRKHKILRYNWRNAVIVCKHGCHQKIDSLYGIKLLEKLRPFDMRYLRKYENQVFKQYLIDNCISEREFLQQKKEELVEIIKRD